MSIEYCCQALTNCCVFVSIEKWLILQYALKKIADPRCYETRQERVPEIVEQ